MSAQATVSEDREQIIEPSPLHRRPDMISNDDVVGSYTSDITTHCFSVHVAFPTTVSPPDTVDTHMPPRSSTVPPPQSDLPSFLVQSSTEGIVSTPFSMLQDPFEYPFPPTSNSSGILSPGFPPLSSSASPSSRPTSPISLFHFSKSSSELPDILYHSPPESPKSDRVYEGKVGHHGRRNSGSFIHPQMKRKEPPIPPSLREKLKNKRWHSISGLTDSSFIIPCEASPDLDSDGDSNQADGNNKLKYLPNRPDGRTKI